MGEDIEECWGLDEPHCSSCAGDNEYGQELGGLSYIAVCCLHQPKPTKE